MQDYWRRLQVAVQRFGWEERLIIGVVILAALIVCAVYVVRKIRNWVKQPNPSLSDHMNDFRRMRDAGEIDDKEFHRVVNTASRHQVDDKISLNKEPPAQPEQTSSPTQGG